MRPTSSILMATAIVAQSGEEIIKPSPESEMSKRRLSIVRLQGTGHRLQVTGCLTCYLSPSARSFEQALTQRSKHFAYFSYQIKTGLCLLFGQVRQADSQH